MFPRLPKAALASVAALMLLVTPWMSMGAGPGDDGEPPAGPLSLGGGGSSGSAGGDEALEPPYILVDAPDDAIGFGSSVAVVGDVDADGADDIVVGQFSEYYEYPPGRPSNEGNLVLHGRADRALNTSQFYELDDDSQTWRNHASRWLGDVNGDGYDDMVSSSNWDWYWLRDWEDMLESMLELSNLKIRYGSADGLPEEPDDVLDLKPEGPYPGPDDEWWWWPESQGYGGVGDVNGDGYNDLATVRLLRFHREVEREDGEMWVYWWPEYDIQLFYGSSNGISKDMGWNYSPGGYYWDWYDYGPLFEHADVNGDGYDDLILVQEYSPHISVFFGSASGPSREPDQTISFSDYYYDEWQLHAPVDLDGDEYEDVALTYGESEGLFNYVMYVYEFPGSARGIPSRPASESTLSTKSHGRAALTDVNGDGLDDVFVYRMEGGEDGYEQGGDLDIQLHFNTGEGYNRNPSWQYTVPDLDRYPVDYWEGMGQDVGDVDGDGSGDLVLSLVSHYDDEWYPGMPLNATDDALVVLFGGAVMDMLRPVRLLGGPRLYAGLRAYDLRVNLNPGGGELLVGDVSLTLDPGGADVRLKYSTQFPPVPFLETSDPDDLVTLTSTADDLQDDSENNTAYLHFRVVFNWTWPHEDPCDVRVEWTRSGEVHVEEDLFSVENDLQLVGNATLAGEWQGPLEEGDWVRAGEAVTLSGPVVAYEGTADVHPPEGTCNASLANDDGDAVLGPVGVGTPVRLSLVADDATDPEELLTLSLANLPEGATLVDGREFALRVDGEAPTFGNAVPEPDDWHSSRQVLVSITADDEARSGVDASTLQYSRSTDGGATWSDWGRAGLETTGDGPTVDGMAPLELPDGSDNLVRWRARDLVGNGWAVSEGYRILVDTINVTYTDPIPDSGVWQTDTSVTTGVTVTDRDGAGIEVASIQYRASPRNLSSYGPWQDWDEGSTVDGQVVTVREIVDLGESAYNFIQWRAKDIAGNGYTTSPHYRVRVDATPVTFYDLGPTKPQAEQVVNWWANMSDNEGGSGVDLSSLEYRLRLSGEDWSLWTDLRAEGVQPFANVTVPNLLTDGADNAVQLRCHDGAGNGPSVSPELVIVVDTTPPTFSPITPSPYEKQPGPVVTVAVEVRDEVVGLDTGTIEYRWGTGGETSLGEWEALPGHRMVVDAFYGSVELALLPGTENVVQFRAADRLGHSAATEVHSIWVNRAPRAVIDHPTAGTNHTEGEPIAFDGNGSSDPDGDELTYTWYLDGSNESLGDDSRLEALVPVGVHNVTLRVEDDDGAWDEATVQVTVEALPPPEPRAAFPYGFLLLVVLVVVLSVAAGYYVSGRR